MELEIATGREGPRQTRPQMTRGRFGRGRGGSLTHDPPSQNEPKCQVKVPNRITVVYRSMGCRACHVSLLVRASNRITHYLPEVLAETLW